MTLFVQLLLLN